MAAKIMHSINEDGDFQNLSVQTVRNLMHNLGFVFKKRNQSSVLLAQKDIQQWQHEYLGNIQ